MSISLTQGMRNAVYSMSDIQSLINISNRRLATGKKVNDPLDNATSFFRSQGYQKESRDLSNLLDSMDTGLRAITKVTTTMDAARKLIESAQSQARQAATLGGSDATRDTYGGQAAQLLDQAVKVLFDSGFGGVNLLQTTATAGTPLTLITNAGTGTAQTSVSINNYDVRFGQAAGLVTGNALGATHGMAVTAATAGAPEAIAYTATAADLWSGTNGTARINAMITWSTSAISRMQTIGSTLASQAAAIQIRQDFTKAWIRTNNEASDYLTLADMNEEGANLAALQTKQQLSVQALSLASRADQAILRLF